MNSLTLGFFYVTGLSWLLAETCLMAGNGSWGPFWLFFLGFAVVFAILGCWPVSDKAVNSFGALSAIVIGIALVLISFATFRGSFWIGSFKMIFALMFLVFSILSLLTGKKEKEGSAHGH